MKIMKLLLWLLSIGSFSLSLLCYNLWNKRRSLKASIEALADTGFDISGSSQQVASVSADLQAASVDQLDSLLDTSAASHQINMMISKTKDSTQVLSSEAEQLKNMSAKGSLIIDQMVDSSLQMKEGNEYLKREIDKSIEELSEALTTIKEIANKTQLINDIVFQTKLLSFNASVEAARAGEHGKGFSVVAEEIGKLAQMSGKSADEISTIVTKSVNSTNKAIETVKTRIEKITTDGQKLNEQTYEHSKNCDVVFKDISGKINSINKMIEGISVASIEQSDGINQLDLAILKLQEVADRNRLVASQSTEHAVEFEVQSKNIIEINQKIAKENNFDTYKKPRIQKFIWNDKLIIGVNEMDNEHKILVEKINILVEDLEAQYTKKDAHKLMTSFNDLANYTIHHFKDEETFMESIAYPQLASHKKIHEKLLNQVAAYGEKIQRGDLNDQELISFLRNWLISHIMGVDNQYAKSVA